MKVVSYAMFYSVERFEEWQASTPGIQIINVQPILNGISGDHKDISGAMVEYELTTSVGVFVTFFKDYNDGV